MLGKRARAHMRRTTSMRGMTVDPAGEDDDMEAPPPSDHPQNPIGLPPVHVVEGLGLADAGDAAMMVGVGRTLPPSSALDHDHDHHRRLRVVLSPRYYQRDLADDQDHGGLETANFLRTCGLCNRRLAPGRDIYMYRYVFCVCVCVFFFSIF